MSRTFKSLIVVIISCMFLMGLCACSGNTPKIVQNAIADGTYKTDVFVFGGELEQLAAGERDVPVIISPDRIVYISNPEMIPDSPDMDCYVDLTADKLVSHNDNIYCYDGVAYHYPTTWGDSEFAIVDGTYEVTEPFSTEQKELFIWNDSAGLQINDGVSEREIYVCRPNMVADSPDGKCYITLENAKLEGFDCLTPYYKNVTYHYPAEPQLVWSADLASCEIKDGKVNIGYTVVPGVEKKMEKRESQCRFVDDGLGTVEEIAEYDEGLYQTVYVIHSIA